MLNLNEPRKSGPFALFNLAFRPFFLLGAATAAVGITLWLILFSKGAQVPYYSSNLYWHAHEMLFGFSIAIIVGFLLTAVRNWTSVQTINGKPLAALTILWLLGRLLPLMPGLPQMLFAVVDLAFLPLVAVALAHPILKAGNYRNLMFVPILLAFFGANLAVHLEMLGITENTAMQGIYAALYLVIAVITIIGGRVIPFFTERGVQGAAVTRRPWLEKLILPATFGWLLTMIFLDGWAQTVLSGLLAVLSLVRLSGWFSRKVLSVPLVWILQLGYLCLPLGFALMTAASQGLVSTSMAIHAFAVGGIGLLTLGMMTRVSLGHTARPLQVNRLMQTAFVLMALAALVRLAVYVLPIPYMAGLHLSGTLWLVAWLLFLVRYVPILIKPRLDGLFG